MKRTKAETRALKARTTTPAHAPAAPPQRARGLSGFLPPWVVLLGCAALLGGTTFAVFHFVILSRVPHTMLGKWVVVGEEMKGATLEFFRDGTMIGTVNMQGKEGAIKAKVEVDGQTMRVTSTNPYTNQPETDTQTIRTLTNDQLVLEDRKGTVLKMERLSE